MDREETDRTLVHCGLTNTALTGSATDDAVGAATVTRGVRSAAQGRRAGAGLATLEGRVLEQLAERAAALCERDELAHRGATISAPSSVVARDGAQDLGQPARLREALPVRKAREEVGEAGGGRSW